MDAQQGSGIVSRRAADLSVPAPGVGHSGDLGRMTALTAIGLIVLALALAMIGGALMGTWIAGEYLGKRLAAMMGAFFGPAAVMPAVVLGVVVLAWLS